MSKLLKSQRDRRLSGPHSAFWERRYKTQKTGERMARLQDEGDAREYREKLITETKQMIADAPRRLAANQDFKRRQAKRQRQMIADEIEQIGRENG